MSVDVLQVGFSQFVDDFLPNFTLDGDDADMVRGSARVGRYVVMELVLTRAGSKVRPVAYGDFLFSCRIAESYQSATRGCFLPHCYEVWHILDDYALYAMWEFRVSRSRKRHLCVALPGSSDVLLSPFFVSVGRDMFPCEVTDVPALESFLGRCDYAFSQN